MNNFAAALSVLYESSALVDNVHVTLEIHEDAAVAPSAYTAYVDGGTTTAKIVNSRIDRPADSSSSANALWGVGVDSATVEVGNSRVGGVDSQPHATVHVRGSHISPGADADGIHALKAIIEATLNVATSRIDGDVYDANATLRCVHTYDNLYRALDTNCESP